MTVWPPRKITDRLTNARVTVRRDGTPDPAGTCVCYWMQRAQRGIDNHAVDLAVAIANDLALPVVVYFAGISNFPHANLRHYAFLNRGLWDIEEDLAARNISFCMRLAPNASPGEFFKDLRPALVIGDENPMREPESWRRRVAKHLAVPFYTVDTDVVIPSKLMEKAQYGAYTIRPRLYRALPEFLVPYENLHAKVAWKKPKDLHTDSIHQDMTAHWDDLDRSVKPVETWVGGTHAAQARLKKFVSRMLRDYDEKRNHPELDGTSALSPYLHFGHIGPMTIALAVADAAEKDNTLIPAKDAYFNELIAWRELAVNFVKYQNDRYDTPEAAEDWARTTIQEHHKDEREFLYTRAQLEQAQTHDDLWNAAQIQMLRDGWMHNYLRMYWAKKILEWTPDVATAMDIAIYLNDKYFLDGRDPNGYAGIAWAILGKFDRAWGERPIFGKRRFMSGASTGKKFDSKAYIRQMNALPEPK
ncbi:deoxyribodipyrimidine photo-lyase [Granulicella pectinivorans]|uniref:Deoxyribodipyrimidine photo-lyase n=1 Tax=Granulicella pectinivorans TaxID=474950 RepID=A0A1I6LF41_9BACT|nr:deoxyribodipyrimidine photo-lyase [Granulicella pectinivorans]SFS02085.1 deoxyribodipyrimidine photo-lyase [Granulicella pectinivorans]